MPCRINTRRKWTARLLLESLCHSHSWFLTLTYAPEHYPADGGVSVRAVQLFMKRVRRAVGAPVRFFAVGEYGTKTYRAHYHVVLFGVSPDHFVIDPRGYLQPRELTRWWPFGMVSVGELQPARMSYVAGYCAKKWTKPDAKGLGDRPPEFMRCSLKPPIGALAVPYLKAFYETPQGRAFLAEVGDTQAVFRQDGLIWPLDRTMRDKLREALAIPTIGAERLPKPIAEAFRPPTPEEAAAREARHTKLRRAFARYKAQGI